jgi:hypothetical protein
VNVDTSEFRALRDEVADLAAQVEHLKHEAIMIRTIEEMVVRHAGYPVSPAARTGRPRHLRPVGGGAS